MSKHGRHIGVRNPTSVENKQRENEELGVNLRVKTLHFFVGNPTLARITKRICDAHKPPQYKPVFQEANTCISTGVFGANPSATGANTGPKNQQRFVIWSHILRAKLAGLFGMKLARFFCCVGRSTYPNRR